MKRQAFYFSDGPYLQTLHDLHSALSAPEAFIKLIGLARTGKSSLCEKLAQFLRHEDYRVVYFGSAIESPDMLRLMLSRELDLTESYNFARIMEDELAAASEKPIILIFDDAHLLTDITLLEIYRLAEIQHAGQRLLNIVLCGEPSLEQRLLTRQEFKSLLLNVSHKFLLEPMDDDTLSHFLISYLEKAGLPGLQLMPTAMTYFRRSCKGYPGPAATLCRLIVDARLGQVELTPIDKGELANLVKNASNSQLLSSSQYRENNQRSVMGPVAAVLVIASIGFLYQQLNSPASSEEDQVQLVMENTNDGQASPFTDVPASVQAAAVAQSANVEDAAVSAELSDRQAIAEPLQSVADSNLVLVTVAERGVAAADIEEPVFEKVSTAPAAVIDEPADSIAVENTVAGAEASANTSELAPSANVPATIKPDEAPSPVLVESAQAEFASNDIDADEIAVQTVEVQDRPAIALVDDASVGSPVVAQQPETLAITSVEASIEEESRITAAVIEQSVKRWISTWENRTLELYFASYHPDFVSRYHDTQAAWRRNRQRVIGNAQWISLEMTEFQIVSQNSDNIEVQFWLSYASLTYRDDTLKKLLLRKEAGAWLIVEEINLVVRS